MHTNYYRQPVVSLALSREVHHKLTSATGRQLSQRKFPKTPEVDYLSRIQLSSGPQLLRHRTLCKQTVRVDENPLSSSYISLPFPIPITKLRLRKTIRKRLLNLAVPYSLSKPTCTSIPAIALSLTQETPLSQKKDSKNARGGSFISYTTLSIGPQLHHRTLSLQTDTANWKSSQ